MTIHMLDLVYSKVLSWLGTERNYASPLDDLIAHIFKKTITANDAQPDHRTIVTAASPRMRTPASKDDDTYLRRSKDSYEILSGGDGEGDPVIL